MDNKEKIRELTEELLERSFLEIKKAISKALNSGALSVDEWSEENEKMILPKIIAIAVLENEAEQYKGGGTKYASRVKKEVQNLKRFL